MSERQRGLGRGLSALLGEQAAEVAVDGSTPAPTGVRMAPIESLKPNPEQPRKIFNPADLEELAASIRDKGVLQPILVRPQPGQDGVWQIIAGERRWRAAQLARLTEAPIIVREMDDLTVFEVAIIENVQRADLNPLEEADAYRMLMDRFGRTQDAVAGVVGKSRSHVANTLRLLALPRLLGYAFNPLSVWFCDAPDGRLQAIVYEVNNTFGERHSYLIEVPEAQRGARLIEQGCDKRLFVSPFLDMDLAYRFRIEPPGERLSIGVDVHRRDGGAAVLHARLDARRRPLSDGALWRTFFAYPLLTLKVIVGIHWEALPLWRKGARLRPRPAPPAQAMSVVRSGDSSSS